jgi:hypothetical protein
MWRVAIHLSRFLVLFHRPPSELDVTLLRYPALQNSLAFLGSRFLPFSALLVESVQLSAFRIPHQFYQVEFLPPFALWLAFPTSVDGRYSTD